MLIVRDGAVEDGLCYNLLHKKCAYFMAELTLNIQFSMCIKLWIKGVEMHSCTRVWSSNKNHRLKICVHFSLPLAALRSVRAAKSELFVKFLKSWSFIVSSQPHGFYVLITQLTLVVIKKKNNISVNLHVYQS